MEQMTIEAKDEAEVVVDLTKTSEAQALAEVVEATEAEKAAKAEAEAKAKLPPTESWEVKKLKERVAKLTAQNKEKETALAKAAAPAPDDAALREREIETKAEVRAREIAAQASYNERTLAVLEAGKSSFEDFVPKVEALKATILDPSDTTSPARYHGLIAGILETSDGDPAISAKLIHLLGSDPELADRLAGSSPIRLGKELAKLAEQDPPEPLSKAPKPLTPVGGRAGAHTPIDPTDVNRADKLSMAEWYARREADVKAKRAAGLRIR
jgi:hypothetical protein